MKCEIIIIKYGLPELEQECIDSVIEHTTDVDYVLTVHDNYEDDEGLSKVWNELICNSDADYICLLNNDTRVEDKWLNKLLECFDEDENLGALGPMTNASTGPQGNLRKWQTKTKRLMQARYPLVGFCLVFPRKVWEEIGGFDEGYEIYGEDSDFIMEVKERRYTVKIRTDVFIFHHGKSSTPIAIARGKDLLKMKAESKARFIKKWKSGPLTEVQKEELAEKEEEMRLLREEKAEARAAANKLRDEERKADYNERRQAAAAKRAGMSRMDRKRAALGNDKLDAAKEEKKKRKERYLAWKQEKRKNK